MELKIENGKHFVKHESSDWKKIDAKSYELLSQMPVVSKVTNQPTAKMFYELFTDSAGRLLLFAPEPEFAGKIADFTGKTIEEIEAYIERRAGERPYQFSRLSFYEPKPI